MTTAETVPTASRATPPWQDPTLPVAERVELLLAEMTLEEKVGQLGSRWVGNDHGATTGARPPTDDRPLQRRADAGRLRRRAARVPLEEASRHGLGHLTRVYGSVPVDRRARAPPSWSASSEVVLDGSRLGIPALVHEECLTGFTDVRRDGLPRRHRLGRDVRPRPGRADGRRDRPGHGRASACTRACRRCSTSSATTAGAGSRRRWARTRTWSRCSAPPTSAACRAPACIATLKHFAGYSASRAGPQPRAGVDGPARAAGRHPAAVRDGGRAGRRGLGDELLLRRRRRPGRRGPLAAHRPAARRVGVRRHGGLRLLGGAVPRHRCTGSPPDTDEAGALALDGRHRRRAAGHARLRRRAGRAGPPRRAARGARRPGRPAAAHARRSQLGLLDPDWTPRGLGRRARPTSTSTRRPTGRSPGEMAERSVVLLDAGTALPLLGEERPASRRVAVVGPCADDPRTFMGCYAFPNHVLPAPPRTSGSASRCRRVARRAARRAARRRGRARAGLRGAGRRTGPASPPPSPRPARPTCASRSSATSPGLFGHGTSGEGCDAEDLRLPGVQADLLDELLATGTPVVVVVVSGPPVRAGRRARPGRRSGAGVHARRGGRRRRSPACSPAGSSPAASCRCRSRGAPGGQPGTYLQPPLGGRERRHQPRSTPPRCSRSGTAPRTPRFEVDDLRLSDDRGPHRRRVHRDRRASATPATGPATRSSSSTCTTSSPRSPGRCGS